VTHEIARLLREIAYELIAIAMPGLVTIAGGLLLFHHLALDQPWLIQFAKDQPWLFALFAFAMAYASGQIVQATGHVAIYWLKLPWSMALLALSLLERVPWFKWLKVNRYFRLLDVPNDRADVEDFKKSVLYKRAKTILAKRSGVPEEEIGFANARDMALAALGQDASERHKFLNLSEFCIGMAGAHFFCAATVTIEALCHGHDHGAVVVALIGITSIFMLRQPRYFSISEKVVFGQLLMKYGPDAKASAGAVPEAGL
jgi:hypothetical protein